MRRVEKPAGTSFVSVGTAAVPSVVSRLGRDKTSSIASARPAELFRGIRLAVGNTWPVHRPADPSPKAAIEAEELVRRFGTVTALDHVSLTVFRGEFFSLLGPSGCGKTTFLRIVAGLDLPEYGTLRLAGKDIRDVPAHRRPVNTVFQSYALFPHMTVAENIAFGLEMKKVPKSERAVRVGRAMDLVQISNLAARKPHQMSGGQKQRVALARALVNEPDVVLLDEPLGALDVKLRRELQTELHALQRRLGVTFIHVTHDQDEALSLSDRLAVMNHGRIVQAGTPMEVYRHPRNAFVAQFVGGCNLLAGRSLGDGTVQTALGLLRLSSNPPAGSCSLAIRPETIFIGEPKPGENCFIADVVDVTFTGPETHLLLSSGGASLKGLMVNRSGARRIAAGELVTCGVAPDSLLVLEND